jgi:hypothetical protein
MPEEGLEPLGLVYFELETESPLLISVWGLVCDEVTRISVVVGNVGLTSRQEINDGVDLKVPAERVDVALEGREAQGGRRPQEADGAPSNPMNPLRRGDARIHAGEAPRRLLPLEAVA